MKYNITTTTPQTMTCAELDTYTKAHLGLRTTLTEPETVNTNPPFPLTQDTHLPTQITTPDGIYLDTKQKLQAKGINVTLGTGAKEYVRLLCEDVVYNVLILADTDGDGIVSKDEANVFNKVDDSVRQAFFAQNKDVVDLSILQYFPNIKILPSRSADGSWVGGNSSFNSLTKLGSKYLREWATEYTQFPKLARLVMPSVTTLNCGQGTQPLTSKCELIDFGPNLSTWYSSCNMTGPTGSLVLRKNSVFTRSYSLTVTKIFVPAALVSSYKADSSWSDFADKFFPIGGPTWASTFGSTDPYADLTPEEKSWYEDLFPTLYDGWQAPTED